MTRRHSGWQAAAAGASALAALLCAPLAASAQLTANPTDVLAPAEQDEAFTFTFRGAEADQNVWTLNEAPSLELSAGPKWRFTLDLDSQNAADDFQFDSLSAGAFFDVTPRMRLGGALSFSDEGDAFTRATRGALGDDVPEVKFESAFKF